MQKPPTTKLPTTLLIYLFYRFTQHIQRSQLGSVCHWSRRNLHQRNEVAATRAALAQCKAAPAAVASKSCRRSTETFRKCGGNAEVYKYRLEGWEILMHIHT